MSTLTSLPRGGTPMATAVPPQSRASMALRSTAGWPTQSNAQVTPPGPERPGHDFGPWGTIFLISSTASALRGVDEVGGAELAGQSLLRGHGVDGDDAAGGRQAQGLDHVQAHSPDAEDGRGLARPRPWPGSAPSPRR